MKLLRSIYSLWGLSIFIITYIFLFPFFWIIIRKEEWHRYARFLNRIWAGMFYHLCLIPFKVEIKGDLEQKQPYIYCANHASYLDIPALGMSTPDFGVFVGKNSLSKVPLFGYMFSRLHIPIDRKNPRSSIKSLERAKEVLRRGDSIIIFPEGGIITKEPPNMVRFKDGAFRVAIEQQVPIVPTTLPHNWIVLDDFGFNLRRHETRVVFHEPIPTKGMTIEDLPRLKEQTYQVIHHELLAHHADKLQKGA